MLLAVEAKQQDPRRVAKQGRAARAELVSQIARNATVRGERVAEPASALAAAQPRDLVDRDDMHGTG